MKNLILSLPRSRSSYLINTVCNFYQVKNYFELYAEEITHVNRLNLPTEEFFKKYRRRIEIVNQKIFSVPGMGIKLVPAYFFYFNGCLGNDNSNYIKKDLVHKNIITNITETFSLNQYDNIYLLGRQSLTDIVCSYIHANHTSFHYESKHDYKRFPLNPKNFVLENEHQNIDILTMIFVLFSKLEQYLKDSNISYIKLDYDNVTEYVAENFPNTRQSILENNLDYKNMVPNYFQIDRYVSERFSTISEICKDIKFY